MFGSSDLIEPEFAEPYKAWQAAPGQDSNAAMLKVLHPTIEGAIRTHVGEPNPLLTSRARLMTLDGLKSYNPKRGRLQTHIYNHLQGLKRVARQQTQIMHIPERVALDRYHLDNASQSLTAELGREPTDDELADHTGFSPRRLAHIRRHQPPVSEGAIDQATMGAGAMGGVTAANAPEQSPWLSVIYDELDPYHKKVFEHTLGWNGRQPLSNLAIASKLQRSPGAISQAKLRIQKMIDEMEELKPLG